MFDRLNIIAVLRGHWKGLRDRSGADALGADYLARGVLLGVTLGVAVIGWQCGLQLKQPGVLFAGLSLLSSGLLAAFAQLASIRSRFPVPDDPEFDTEADTRNMLDEAVAHVLTAALLAAVAAALIIVAINAGGIVSEVQPAATSAPGTAMPAPTAVAPASEAISTAYSVPIAALSAYLFVLFIMTIRKLYAAYVVGNEVPKELSGHHRG